MRPLHLQLPPAAPPRLSAERGSALITALLLTTGIAIAIAGYLSLSRTALKLSHRTFFANDAGNLAEIGLEEALYSFNLMGNGTAVATAWTGWTLSGANASRTLTPFNRDQNAVGVVKVYVKGYNGTDPVPYVISQATITPFDGSAPIVKVLQIKLKYFPENIPAALVGINGLTLTGTAFADSFNSNPAGSPTGPWAAYPGTGATAITNAMVQTGVITIGTGQVKGTLKLGTGVTAPPPARYTGLLTTNYSATFPLPAYPTVASVSQSYNLVAVPATLPRGGDLPASDGRYYYFCTGNIGATTITAGMKVTITGGPATRLNSGLVVPATSSCFIYLAERISVSGATALSNSSWAGAVRIYTSTANACSIGTTGAAAITACVYAPNAALSLTGTGTGGMIGSFVAGTITVANGINVHYDAALRASATAGPWDVNSWYEMQSSVDLATRTALTGGFLP